MIYFLIILVIIIVAIFFIPIKFTIDANIKGKNVYNVDNNKQRNKIKITLKVLGFIPVYVYNKEKKSNKKDNNITISKLYGTVKNSVAEEEFKITNFTKKILSWCEKVNFKKLVLVAGFNTEDYVKNAYISATLNTLLCMIINANQKKFNFKKLYYQIGISDYNYYLVTDTVITFNLFRNIDVFITIIKFIFNLKKENSDKTENNINNNINLKNLSFGK